MRAAAFRGRQSPSSAIPIRTTKPQRTRQTLTLTRFFWREMCRRFAAHLIRFASPAARAQRRRSLLRSVNQPIPPPDCPLAPKLRSSSLQPGAAAPGRTGAPVLLQTTLAFKAATRRPLLCNHAPPPNTSLLVWHSPFRAPSPSTTSLSTPSPSPIPLPGLLLLPRPIQIHQRLLTPLRVLVRLSAPSRHARALKQNLLRTRSSHHACPRAFKIQEKPVQPQRPRQRLARRVFSRQHHIHRIVILLLRNQEPAQACSPRSACRRS